MSKFKVGNKVIGNDEASKRYSITKKGWIGKVTEVSDNDWIRVHGKNPYADIDQSFDVKVECFDLYEEPAGQKIVITTDGKTTTAVLYDGKKRIKDAKAICAPSDTFDFEYGAALALDRLTGFARGGIMHTLEANSDWDKFIAGEIAFEMTADKFDAFLKEVEERFPKLRWICGQKPTKWKPSYPDKCYFKVDDDGELCWGDNDGVKRVQWTSKSGLDWKKFAEGKLEVKVSKEKYDEFMKLCEDKKFTWADDVAATKINPWKEFDKMPGFLKAVIDITNDKPVEYIYVMFVGDEDQLKWNNKHDEDRDEYEFV